MEKKISLIIDEEVLKRVDEKAKQTLRSRGKFIEYVLREYLKEEDLRQQTGFLKME